MLFEPTGTVRTGTIMTKKTVSKIWLFKGQSHEIVTYLYDLFRVKNVKLVTGR